ncbi:MAG: uracil phosphoribosyltransferase [Minisyncoccota bacterium]
MQKPVSTLRNRKTSTKEFRKVAHEIAAILAKESLRRMRKAKSKKVVLVPILRAGLALLPAFLEIFPEASVGFIGLKRNEKTLKPKAYYQNISKVAKSDKVIVLDPMLATGGSAVAAITALIKEGAQEKNIMFVGVISAPEGLEKLQTTFPKIDTLIALHDEKLDKKGYIVPGLGDFGDRYFAS